jgi:hypothetical protein
MTTYNDPFVFHITLKGKRTTISLDNYLSDLLALHLKEVPGTQTAHRVIRSYLTDQLLNSTAFDPYLPVSKQARKKALEAIARPELLEQHFAWMCDE